MFGHWIALIASAAAISAFSWLFFRAFACSIPGLQKLQDRIQDKKVTKRIGALYGVVVAIIVVSTANDVTIYSGIIEGGLIGLSAGFFGAIYPKHIKDEERK
jgi:flagellar biosynthesis protein FliR